jgi:hypothetical protein
LIGNFKAAMFFRIDGKLPQSLLGRHILY